LTDFDLQIAADRPAKLLQSLVEHRGPHLPLDIVRSKNGEHAKVARALGLLRAYRKRPNRRRTAEKRDEIAPVHVHPLGSEGGILSAQKSAR
jgi:hypothetical protein